MHRLGGRKDWLGSEGCTTCIEDKDKGGVADDGMQQGGFVHDLTCRIVGIAYPDNRRGRKKGGGMDEVETVVALMAMANTSILIFGERGLKNG